MSWWPERLLMVPPIFLMVVLVAINHLVIHRRSRRQTARDARGLRAGLRAELDMLGRLIEDDLALLRRSEEYLLSLRALTQVYRGNLGRLTMLGETEIEVLVRAYGAAEAAELFIAATSRPHGAHAYRVWLEPAAWREAAQRLEAARTAVAAALDVMAPRGASAGNAPHHLGGDAPEPADGRELTPATA